MSRWILRVYFLFYQYLLFICVFILYYTASLFKRSSAKLHKQCVTKLSTRHDSIARRSMFKVNLTSLWRNFGHS